MKKTLSIVLALEITICALLHIFGQGADGSVLLAAAFPFEQIGAGLRALSLSGGAGNVAAIIIYCAACLLPALYLAVRALKSRVRAEDGLLAVLCVLLFTVIYLMINPAILDKHLGTAEFPGMGKAMCGISVYLVTAGYIILRAIRALSGGNPDSNEVQFATNQASIMRWLRILMGVLCVIFIYAIFGSGVAGFISAVRQVTEANTGAHGAKLAPSYMFLFIQYLVTALPHAFSIAVVFSGINLVKALEEDEFGESVAAAAHRIGGICKTAVICTMLSQIALSLAQLALGSAVRSSNYIMSIPILSIVFVLAAKLLAQYFEQARLLKADNDSII